MSDDLVVDAAAAINAAASVKKRRRKRRSWVSARHSEGPPFRRSAIPTSVRLPAHRRRHGKMCYGVLGVHHSQKGVARYSQGPLYCTLE